MARKKKEQAVIVDTTEVRREHALRHFNGFDKTPINIVPTPSRFFEIGETVSYGHLKNCVIEQVNDDGKSYLIKYEAKNESISYICAWWFDIQRSDICKDFDNDNDSLFSQYHQVELYKQDLDSIFFLMTRGGIVCDPMYQRDYVWTDFDREQLLDSLFDRLDLGSIILISHRGYLHERDQTMRVYRTIDQREIGVKACDDYTSAIVDGQQRLTTLYNFWTDRFKYRGKLFSELSARDRHGFKQTQLSVRMFKEDHLNIRDVVRLFIQTNRGVTQSPAHLTRMQQLYNELEAQ